MTPRLWPTSGSEYLPNDMQLALSLDHLKTCANPFCVHRQALTCHEIARDTNEVRLKLLHDRYATAAGFRD